MPDADPPRTTTYSLLFDVFVLNQAVRRLLHAAMADSPLRPEEYAIYSVVFEDEAVSPTAMAARLSMPLTTVAEYVREMEARGDARRMPNPRDGRSYLLVLTASGLAAHREANQRFERADASMRDALGRGEAPARQALASLLSAAQSAAAVQTGVRQ